MSTSLSGLFFKYRSYTPLPFIVIMLIYENANIWSLIGGFIIVVVGESIRLWGVSWAGSETRTTDKPGGSHLVISGPFAHLRNPLYSRQHINLCCNRNYVFCNFSLPADFCSYFFLYSISLYN